LIGFFADVGLHDDTIILIWAPGGTESLTGYNIYRRIAGAAEEKLNDAPITEMPFGPNPSYPKVLAFLDSTVNVSSVHTYQYHVTSISTSGKESPKSDAVTLIPNNVYPYPDIQGLYPYDHADVDVVPTFTWTPVSNAESYIVYLQEALPNGGPFLWLYHHRSLSSSLPMGANSGTAFIDELPDRLHGGTLYCWGLWAVNADNFAFAGRDAKFTTRGGSVVRTLVDQFRSAGYYCVWWDQQNAYGMQVITGPYVARLTIDQIEFTANFEISDAAPPVNAMCIPLGGLPTSASISAYSTEWPLGEPVMLIYGIPADTQVRIDIEYGSP
jgi:hypothetical protein